ncbi:MAG: NAD(P)H-dependent oxidoreductase [Deltaproteobacteria bacterium]|jgi:multimeric flavodoxin WrbA|nr:NAD(P)H-dependent oxidoreductase [Deltaproteobacteria bacterium]
MKIAVINGSPKGKQSITLQYVKYMQIKHSNHEWIEIDAGKEISKLEKNKDKVNKVIEIINSCDGILWATPVYYFNVPSQVLRFLNLVLNDKALQQSFKNKYTALITTSINYFDHTAHRFFHAMSSLLEMKTVDTISPNMETLFSKPGRKKLDLFMKNFLEHLKNKYPGTYKFNLPKPTTFNYQPAPVEHKIHSDNKITIITDKSEENSNLGKMIDRFSSSFNSTKIQQIEIAKLGIKSGCRGCLKCASDLVCVFDKADKFRETVAKLVVPADIIIFAVSIENIYLSFQWQQFITRFFCNGHVPLFQNKQIGVLVSGPLSEFTYLQDVLGNIIYESESNLAGFVTDEEQNSEIIDLKITDLARKTELFHKQNYFAPKKFPGVAGRKIFRVKFLESIGVVFPNDFKHYSRQGYFDFPNTRFLKRFVNFIIRNFLKIPPIKKRFYHKEIVPGMIRPYTKILNKHSSSK